MVGTCLAVYKNVKTRRNAEYEKANCIFKLENACKFTFCRSRDCKRNKNYVGNETRVEIFILPTFPMIPFIGEVFTGSHIGYGAQNVCHEEKGAYTGEVPPLILQN